MKLFVLLSRVPYPIEKGDKLRAFHQIRLLAKHHHIILCALNTGKADPQAIPILKEYCKEVHIIQFNKLQIAWNLLRAFINGRPFQVGYFYNYLAQRKINRLLNATRPDHIYCQLHRVAEYVRNSSIPKTLDYQDVFSIGMKRRSETSSWWLKPLLIQEYKRLIRYEKAIFNDFNNRTIISIPDRDLIPHTDHDKIVVVPNGVDHDYFHLEGRSKTNDIVFTGNMGYIPNVNAAEYLVSEIFPLVRNRLPSTRLMLAGANPHPRVSALASEFITVTGWVADLRESYAMSKVFIAPMRIGTGLQNKLLEAMAMGLPCITSPLANSALGAKEGEEILIGHSPEEFAEHLIHLLTDTELAKKIATHGHEFVKRTFSWENSTEILNNLISNTKT